jgi:putative nucleotidyltransferase with HDIG domain
MLATPQGSPTASSAAPELEAAIIDLVSRGAVKVPPYPAVAMRVEEMVRREDYGLGELTRLVASDQSLAADALRCANSAFYSRGAPVTSLNAAITRIGAKEVVRLALASGLGVQARKAGPLAVLKRRIWLEALASAALAQELARKRGISPEEAFVCGLLHDFGKMICIVCIEEILKGQKKATSRPLEAWMETIERYHVELGLVLATQWKLPQMVSDVISLHHTGDASGAESPAMVELIAATDEVVMLLGQQSWLTPEDLGTISSLTASECDLVSTVLDKLPGFIASFEGGPAQPATEPSVIDKSEPSQFMTGPKQVNFPVTVTLNREVRAYHATNVATNNLTVNGPAALPENVLMEIKISGPTPLTCWATAKLSWPENGGYTVLLQPFALNGSGAAAWKAMARAEQVA